MSTAGGDASRTLAAALAFVPAGSRQALVECACQAFALLPGTVHGPEHWLRVRENGLRLAEHTGADRAVVELFALFHDSQRQNDGWDPGHGRRAAEFLSTLHEPLAFLPEADLVQLIFACTYHTEGWTEAQHTVQTCWDADRLDLGRVGIRPAAERLCTPAAREPDLLAWAYERSLAGRRTRDHEPGEAE